MEGGRADTRKGTQRTSPTSASSHLHTCACSHSPLPSLYLQWERWFHAPGGLPVRVPLDTSIRDAASSLAAEWLGAVSGGAASVTHAADYSTFTPGQRVAFFDELLVAQDANGAALDSATLDALDAAYSLSSVRNSEVGLFVVVMAYGSLVLCWVAKRKLGVGVYLMVPVGPVNSTACLPCRSASGGCASAFVPSTRLPSPTPWPLSPARVG